MLSPRQTHLLSRRRLLQLAGLTAAGFSLGGKRSIFTGAADAAGASASATAVAPLNRPAMTVVA